MLTTYKASFNSPEITPSMEGALDLLGLLSTEVFCPDTSAGLSLTKAAPGTSQPVKPKSIITSKTAILSSFIILSLVFLFNLPTQVYHYTYGIGALPWWPVPAGV